MKFKSIAMRILISVVPAIIIATFAFVILSYHLSNTRINESVNAQMHESLYAANLEIQFELYKNAAVAVDFARYAQTIAPGEYDSKTSERFLAECLSGSPYSFSGGIYFEPYTIDPARYYLSSFSYTGEDGSLINVTNYEDDIDYFHEDWYLVGRDARDGVVWSDVYYDNVAGSSLVTATRPFYDENGAFAGVGIADMSLQSIRAIVNSITVGETGRAFILGANGEYISFFGEPKRVESLMQEDADPALAALGRELSEHTSGTTSFTRDGIPYRVYYSTMSDVGWTLAITIEEAEISSSRRSSFVVMSIIPVLGLLFVVAGSSMVAKYLRRIVNKVNNFAKMAASGDFMRRIDVTEHDEFGFMERQLNCMLANMQEMSERSAALLKRAEDASSAKSNFLSRMSHEIRTPMNAIIGMSQIAMSSSDPQRIHDCLGKIDAASKHLLALINDILDMSKIEANKLELTEEQFRPGRTLENICDMLRVKAEEKNQTLRLDIADNVPPFILGDELRFFQVVTNLVGNALKFTPESGTIELSMQESERDDTHSVLTVRVTDSGIGMSEEQCGRLFRSFEQGDGSFSRRFGGTGLGLAISKRIVEMMDGSIWVESELGHGSTFTFTIRVRRGTGEGGMDRPAAQQTASLKDLHILIVDDSKEANEYLEHILNGFGLQCDKAETGDEAITLVERTMAENRPYDIVFMDYLMPGKNGIETALAIRQISNNSAAIVLVSIYDRENLLREATDADIRKFLTKPVSPSVIIDTINELTYGSATLEQLNQALSSEDFLGNTILIAEDVEINREIVFALLEHTGVTIDFAENGHEAVNLFSLNPKRYDLILMDIQMPGMDGLEATRRIRAMSVQRARTIPIIAMTANALSEDVKRCFDAGMNAHIAKPIDINVLLMTLNNHFFMRDYLEYDIS